MRFITLTLLLGSIGCASTTPYKAYHKHLNAWVGHSLNELLIEQGEPSSIQSAPNDVVVYSWLYERQVGRLTRWCASSFFIVGDRVESVNGYGNDCHIQER